MENPDTFSLRDAPATGRAEYTDFAGDGPPANHEDPLAGYAALKEGAAVVDLSHRTILRLAGKGAVEMLNAVLTNDVPRDGNLGAYALLLNPKGRIQADLRVFKSGEEILVVTEPEGAAAAKELLGRYAPFSRVTLEDLSEADPAWGSLGLYGPRARALLGDLELAEHESARTTPGGATILAVGVASPVSGYDILGPATSLSAVREYLLGRGAVPAGPGAYETARIEAGVPRFGADITPENFPAEAGLLERAVSLQKGCYPGQETVARMHYRGHPNKQLYRLSVEGPSPAPGTPVVQSEKQVGKVTSVTPLAVDGQTLVLAYLSRNADTQDTLGAGEARLRPLV